MERLRRILFLITTFLYVPMYAHFAAGTLVSVQEGFKKVEELCVGERVVGIDPRTGECTYALVTAIEQLLCKKSLIIYHEAGSPLCVAEDALLYDKQEERWKDAQLFCIGSELLTADGTGSRCTQIVAHSQETEFYRITAEKPHTLLISDAQIVAHNFIPLAISVSFAFGGGLGIELSSIGVSIGMAVASYYYTKRNAHELPIEFSIDLEKMRHAECGEHRAAEKEPEIQLQYGGVDMDKAPQLTTAQVMIKEPGAPAAKEAKSSKKQKQSSGKHPAKKHDNEKRPKQNGNNNNKKNDDGNNVPPIPPTSANDAEKKKVEEFVPNYEDRRSPNFRYKTPDTHENDFDKLPNGQGSRDGKGNIWKPDMKHDWHEGSQHWTVLNKEGKKQIMEIGYDGKKLWPNGPKNKGRK